MRLVWLGLLFCAGCQQTTLRLPDVPPAVTLWQNGQAALVAGEPERAVELYRRSLAERDPPAQVHLSLAAAYLEQGDHEAACAEIGHFVEKQTDHPAARYYYAELLWQLGRLDESRRHFERVISDLQEGENLDYRRLIHCHGRLVEAAQHDQDLYQLHLQRGIGLYWLAQGRFEAGDPNGVFPVEGLLCKAAAELSRAHALRPDEARAAWYLSAVWRQLAQAPQADRCLHMAMQNAPLADLTPAEQRALLLSPDAGPSSHLSTVFKAGVSGAKETNR